MDEAAASSRRISRKILLAAVSVILVVSFSELLVRCFWTEPDLILSADMRKLWGLPRGKTIRWAGVETRINSAGYRGPEFNIHKTPAVFRIYLSGDSSFFGHGVPEEQTFAGILAVSMKNMCPPGVDVEVINGGVPGFSTMQSLARLDEDGWAMAPDLVVIGNLWSDAARSDRPDSALLRADGSQGWRVQVLRLDHLLNRLALYRFMKIRIFLPRSMGQVDSRGVPRQLPRRVSPVEYEGNLRRIIAKTRSEGGAAMLVILPHAADQLSLRDERRELARSDCQALGHDEMEQDYREAMRRVAVDTDARLIDLSKTVTSVPRELFIDDLHPNREGHALIAEALTNELAQHVRLWAAKADVMPQNP